MVRLLSARLWWIALLAVASCGCSPQPSTSETHTSTSAVPVPPAKDVPPGVPGALDGWAGFGTYKQADGSLLLPSASPTAVVLTRKDLALHKKAHYEISLQAKTTGAQAALILDLYNGPDYDFAEQDAVIQGLTDTYKPYTVTIPAGTNAPSTGFVRIYSVSPSPIWIKDVQVIEK